MTAFGATDPTDLVEVQRQLEELRARQVPLPQARVFNSANISIPNAGAGPTALTFNSEHWDAGDLHSTSANTGRLTAPITGLYSIGGSITWASNGTGLRFIGVRANGATTIASVLITTVAGSTRQSVATVYRLAAGEYVELMAYQTSGAALAVSAATGPFDVSPEFWMVRLGGYVNQGV